MTLELESDARHDATIEGNPDGDHNTTPRHHLATLRALSGSDTFAVLVLTLLTVALAPGFFIVMNPRHALVLSGLPLGAWLLGRSVIRGDRATILGCAFLIAALVGALTSGSRWPTVVFGSIGSTRELSALSLFAAFCWWAVGRGLSGPGRWVLPIALTAAAAVNIAVGIVQLAFLPSTGLYSAFSGRLSGLMSNPVYFASTFIGVWAYWLVRTGRRTDWVSCSVLSMLAVSLALSGSRGALLVGVLLSGALILVRRRRSAVIAAAVSGASFAAGVALLAVVSRSQTGRIGDVETGTSLRFRQWRAALRAWVDRPITGWGPDPYQKATADHFTAADIREQGTPLLWPDPHNVVVYLLVSVGLLGVILLSLFVASALRGRINWPLLVAAIAITLSWMLQPVMINGWPIAFALFGAAVRPEHCPDIKDAATSDGPPCVDGTTPSQRTTFVLMSIGVVVALAFTTWSFRLHAVQGSGDADRVEQRAGWMIVDASVAMAVARAHFEQAAHGDERERHLARAEELARQAAERAGDPRHWTFLAEVQVDRQDFEGALETELETIERHPAYPIAYERLRLTARILGDEASEALAVERLCEFGSPSCREWLDGE